MAIESLRIEEFSDREFLLIVQDVADDEGWTDSASIAVQLDLAEPRIASSRLSWLRRYGAVEREIARDENGNIRANRHGQIQYTQRWRCTDLGASIASGRLRKGDTKVLDGLDEGAMLLALRHLSERTVGDSGAAKLMQREWRFGHARNK